MQRGDAVVLSFTLPKESTDQEPLATKPTVEVYRSISSTTASGTQPAGSAITKPAPPLLADTIPGGDLDKYAKNGHVEFPDSLSPSDLARNPGEQMSYVVRTRVSSKRASAGSNVVSVPVYPSPSAVGNLGGAVAEDAILLSWSAAAGNVGPPVAGYRIYRTDAPSPAGAAATASPGVTPGTPSFSPLELLGESPQPEYRDTTAQLDHAYSYVVRSIARYGSAVVESADSVPLTIFAKDIFPPAVPQGLEAVVVPETNGMPAYVELAWNISPETDFAGYIVLRSEQNDTTGARLTPDLLSVPTFRDITVVSGRHYFYRVAAVDRDGNVSVLSTAVAADIP